MDAITSTRSNHQTAPYSGLFTLAAQFSEQFSIDWLVSLTGKKPSEVLRSLEQGVHDGILKRVDEGGIFRFQDSKERERWQNQVAPAESKLIHRKITELVLREPMDEDQKALLIVHHLVHCPDSIEKFRWLVKAGDAYVKRYQNARALEHYGTAIEGLCSFHGEDADSLLSDASTKYSKICAASQHSVNIISALAEAAERSKKTNKIQRLALLKMHLAKNEWYRREYSRALRHFQEGWNIAVSSGDKSLLRAASTFSTFFLYWQGRYREAIERYEQFLSDGKYAKHDFPLIGSLMVGHCYALTGQNTRGLSMLHSILSLCQKRGDKHLESQVLHSIGATMLDMGYVEDAIQYLNQSIEQGRKGENRWVELLGNLLLAFALHLKQKTHRAASCLREYLETSKKVKATVLPYPHLIELCWLMDQGKFPRIPGVSWEQEINCALKDKNIFIKGVAYRHLALLEKHNGAPSQKVIKSLHLSLKWLEDSGHQIETAKSRFELARQHLFLGDEIKAKKAARTASKILFSFHDSLIPDDLRFLIKDQPSSEDALKEILRFGKELATVRDYRDLPETILSSANRVLCAERAGLFVLDDGEQPPRLRLEASRNLTSEMLDQPAFESSIHMIREVAQTKQGQISVSDSPDSVSSGRIRSSISFPILRGGKTLAVLYYDNLLLPAGFKKSDLSLLSFFATLTGLAWEYRQATGDLQKLNRKPGLGPERTEPSSLRDTNMKGVIGKSPAITRVISMASQIANTDSNVLIIGETGVGKEMVARWIHTSSQRRDKPFVHVVCSALQETLITSELFGHEKGSFTGANRKREGRIESANGGTLFLDEIGDLSMEVQIRLLRVLQSKEFERVGGNKTLRSDFRLLTATNRNLKEDVSAGRFRSDLYYRLNVFTIVVPPLRERTEDIPLLADHFLRKHSAKMGKSFEKFSEKGIRSLFQYDWPGNVRELENIIEQSVALSPGPVPQIPDIGYSRKEFFDSKGYLTLRQNERLHILWALEKTRWKVRGKGGAAELLDIHPSTLEFRMKKLGIERPLGAKKTKRENFPVSPLDARTDLGNA